MTSASDIDRESLLLGWFGSLSLDLQQALLSASRPIELLDGEQLHDIGADSNGIFGIVSGSLRLMVATHEQTLRFGHLLGPGCWVGEFALILNADRLVDMAAAGPTRVIYISKRNVLEIADRRPDIWQNLAQLSSFQLLQAFGVADDLMLRSPEQRVAATLLRLAQRRGAHPALRPLGHLRLSQQDLATASNVSLSTCGRLLRRFDAEGMIASHYGMIEILRPDGLMQIVVETD